MGAEYMKMFYPYELAGYMGKYDFSSRKTSRHNIRNKMPEKYGFNSARFHDEDPCVCNACGKKTASGIRIYIDTFLENKLMKPYGVQIHDFKGILVFCNECWIPPEIEALFKEEN